MNERAKKDGKASLREGALKIIRVSKPGAAIRIEVIELNKQQQKRLTVKRLPALQVTR